MSLISLDLPALTKRIDLMKDIINLIRNRYSVRDFLPDPLPQEVIDDMIEAARLAPSAQNRQPWRYVIITEPERIKELVKNTGLIGLSNYFIKDAPCLVIACADVKKNLKLNQKDYYLVDVAISFQQMMLAAWAHGVGSCWMAAFNEEKLAKHLGLPKNYRIVAMSPFGYPKADKTLYSKALNVFSGSERRLKKEDILVKLP